MKRILSLLLCVCILAGCFYGCRKIDDSAADEPATENSTAPDSTDNGTTDAGAANDAEDKDEDTTDAPTADTTPVTPPDTTPTVTPPETDKEVDVPDVPGTEMFDGVAFIGDSISLKLQYYHAKTGEMGNATFLCSGSYAVRHAVDSTMLITYKGQNMSPEDALAKCGAKKVFILLGMNDIGLLGIDKTIENWGIFVERIRDKNPGIEICIQSETPIYIGGERGSLTNANVNTYNQRLQQFAKENGCSYIDVATPMKDANGGLKQEYCSDSYVHFTDAACKLWIKLLKDFLTK